ncbi:MAG: PEP-CTERM sorting domain-containing protein [Cyanobacteriota bacterium]|nr:PEP-CTERM sorting domain-containing protein [Cyanobacteriota bacterium]
MTVGLAAIPANAATVMGFQGAYDPSNFTLDNFNADGFVDTSNAPNSILLRGGNNSSGFFGQTSFTATAAATGTVMFDFIYDSLNVDGPAFDPFGVILNGIFTQLTDDNGPDVQSGMFSLNVNQGDTFGFAIQTEDNLLQSSQVEIFNFKAPGVEVPEPASLLSLVAAGSLGLTLKRKLGQRE